MNESMWMKASECLPPLDHVVVVRCRDNCFPYTGRIVGMLCDNDDNWTAKWSVSGPEWPGHCEVEWWCDCIPHTLSEAHEAAWHESKWVAIQRQDVYPGALVAGDFPPWWEDEIPAPRFALGQKIRSYSAAIGWVAGTVMDIRYRLCRHRYDRYTRYRLVENGHSHEVADYPGSEISVIP
jgi:hypothetical protein